MVTLVLIFPTVTALLLSAIAVSYFLNATVPALVCLLQKLKEAIEENFKIKHSLVEYAEMLCITPKALAKITKSYFNKTLNSIINERVIIETKRELYLTDKSVREIAYELAMKMNIISAVFFKTNADVSAQLYRETVGFSRGIV